jgi:DNA polymerase III delta prime subunit
MNLISHDCPASVNAPNRNSQAISYGKPLKELVKAYADLLFGFDHQELTFREDAIALGELLIHLGIYPVDVRDIWLGNHPLKIALVPPFNIPSQYETIHGDILWDVMIDDLETALINLGVKIFNKDAITLLEKVEPLCQDEGELLKISERIKKLFHDFNGWNNVIKPFQQRLSRRVWNESKDQNVIQSDDQIDRAKLEVKQWLLESDPFVKAIKRANLCRSLGIDKKTFDAIADSLDENSSKPRTKIYSPEDFMALPTGGSRTLAPGVPSMGVTLFAGNPGAGKTTLAYDLAGSVLHGDEFLGEVPNRTGHVLFVNCDEPHNFGQDKMINRGIDKNYKVITDWDVSQWIDLESVVEDMRPALVIVDSFNAIHNDPSFDENSAIASQTVKKLERLSAKYCTPIVLIHHLGKSKETKGVNKIRGSSAIAASASSVMILDGEGTVKRLSQPKVRGMTPLNLQIEMNPETGRFTVISGNITDDATKSLSQRLKEFFTANAGQFFETIQINDQFPGQDRKVLNNALNRLVQQGHIIKRPSKNNPRFKVYGCECTNNLVMDSLSSPSVKSDDHIYPCSSANFDDMTSESITKEELRQITIMSPSNHHHVTIENEVIPETFTETANHQITIIEEKGIYECPSLDDDFESVLPEPEPDDIESRDRVLAIGDNVICDKFPGEEIHIANITGDMALCLGRKFIESIPLSELALKV